MPRRASVGAATLGVAALLAPSAEVNDWLVVPIVAALAVALIVLGVLPHSH